MCPRAGKVSQLIEWAAIGAIGGYGGSFMQLRGVMLVLACALLGGCANNTPLSSGFAGPAQAAEQEMDAGKKTLASKVPFRHCARARNRSQTRPVALQRAQLKISQLD
jgi:hypothetical protein